MKNYSEIIELTKDINELRAKASEMLEEAEGKMENLSNIIKNEFFLNKTFVGEDSSDGENYFKIINVISHRIKDQKDKLIASIYVEIQTLSLRSSSDTDIIDEDDIIDRLKGEGDENNETDIIFGIRKIQFDDITISSNGIEIPGYKQIREETFAIKWNKAMGIFERKFPYDKTE